MGTCSDVAEHVPNDSFVNWSMNDEKDGNLYSYSLLCTKMQIL